MNYTTPQVVSSRETKGGPKEWGFRHRQHEQHTTKAVVTYDPHSLGPP